MNVVVRGAVRPLEAQRAEEAIGAVLARRDHSDSVTMRLSRLRNPLEPLVIQVNFQLHETRARMQAAGPGPQAVTRAAGRLDHQLYGMGIGTRVRWWFEPGRRTLAHPSQRASIVRRKHYAWPELDPHNAVVAMDRMDYDAYTFLDAHSGQDCVVYRAGPEGVQLARQHGTYPCPAPSLLAPTIAPGKTPVLDEERAVTLLCEQGLPFLFYIDSADERGRLLYRRYDHELTLLSPTPDTHRSRH
ncbi:hypothetical protein D7D52_10205 [Nocardia yunnanensis]|uniref:Sigma 54 modulation/S30EA ribosomal protein C-terminal domain-containing protein n=1 Tax=Nocardia yunnanensis TaxID=2382165 RepID=A0A386Z949_9NOCA|nr:sigma 54 modulation/S30EA ribosomal C-terminal domain-containing protein [Nocardia yunnanensis]AYF74170.1 hypothetical protein D7D52_10205 [Nocardia yunnanensis]